MAIEAMTSIGIYRMKTIDTAGMRLPRSSFTSVRFVVTTLRNMSTPIIDCENSRVRTIWNAAKNMNGNISHTVRPNLWLDAAASQYSPKGNSKLHAAVQRF